MRSGEADFSSGMGSSRVAPSLSLSLAREVYLYRREEVRLLWSRVGATREDFLFAGYFAGKPTSEGPPSLGGFDSIFGCLLNGYYSIHYFMSPPPISAKLF